MGLSREIQCNFEFSLIPSGTVSKDARVRGTGGVPSPAPPPPRLHFAIAIKHFFTSDANSNPNIYTVWSLNFYLHKAYAIFRI